MILLNFLSSWIFQPFLQGRGWAVQLYCVAFAECALMVTPHGALSDHINMLNGLTGFRCVNQPSYPVLLDLMQTLNFVTLYCHDVLYERILCECSFNFSEENSNNQCKWTFYLEWCVWNTWFLHAASCNEVPSTSYAHVWIAKVLILASPLHCAGMTML